MSRIKEQLRLLRKHQTSSERRLWQFLRNRKFYGLKFKRQHLIEFSSNNVGEFNYFIPDFYCDQHKLILELDGGIHRSQVHADQTRDEILIELGYKIMHIKNEELIDISRVLERIKKELVK